LVFQAKEASVFGILLNSNCRHAVEVGRSLAKVCRSLGKKYFTFLMNNLNEVKLGNFSEIECYVLVSCSKQSLKTLKDYHRLVITPFDFLCAFDLGSLEDYHWDPCLLSFS
jgi:diphthamide biosynthesis protein 2